MNNNIALIFTLFFLLIVFKNNWIPRFLFLFFLVYLSYFYIDLADYEGYLQMYEAPLGNISGQYYLDNTDIGFRILVYIGNYLDLSYQNFKSICYLIFGFIFIRSLVILNPNSANLILALYITYPLLLDLVQVRHFMAMSLFLLAISKLINSIRKNNFTYKILIFFFPPILFHSSFLFLIIIAFLSYILNMNISKRFFFLKNIFILLPVFILTFGIIMLLNVTNFVYFTTETSFYTVLFYSIVYILFYYLLFKANKLINNDLEKKAFHFIFINTTLLIGLTLPMLFYNVEFFRFFRVELIVLISTIFHFILKENSLRSFFKITGIMFLHISLSVIIFYVYYLGNLVYPLFLID